MSCLAFVSSAPARFPFQASVTCKAASDESSHMPCRASLRRTTLVVPCAVEMVKGASLPASIQTRCLFERPSGLPVPPTLASEQRRSRKSLASAEYTAKGASCRLAENSRISMRVRDPHCRTGLHCSPCSSSFLTLGTGICVYSTALDGVVHFVQPCRGPFVVTRFIQ